MRELLDLLEELFENWQAEAQASAEVWDASESERSSRGDASWYWRGRRDGYESAAYDLLTLMRGYGHWPARYSDTHDPNRESCPSKRKLD